MDIPAGADIKALQAALPLPALENRILLSHVTGLSRVQLITQSDRPLSATQWSSHVRPDSCWPVS